MTNFYDLVQEHYSSFSKLQKKLADAFLYNYTLTAYLTTSQLSEMLDISESTIVRFAMELGYDGYSELQKDLQKYSKTKMTPNERIDLAKKRIKDDNIVSAVLNSDIERIKNTLELVDRSALDEAANAIAHSNRVYIIGVRSSFTLANFLHYNLSMIRNNVKLLQPTNTSDIFEQILDIQEGDVLIGISFPRYSKKIFNAIDYAKKQGATVISMTDSISSPIASVASYLLLSQSDMVSFADSLVAPLSLCNALIALTAHYLEDEVKQRFDQLERIWDEYDVYDKK